MSKNPNAGQKESRYYESIEVAEASYEQLLESKEKKGYKPVELASSNIGSQKKKSEGSKNINLKIKRKECSLPEDVQDFVSYIYSEATNSLTSTVDSNITAKGIETPLGILTEQQIDKGEAILLKILEEIKSKGRKKKLQELSSQFFTNIPHKMSRKKEDLLAAVISTEEQYKEKQELVQLMRDLLKIGGEDGVEENVLFTEDVQSKYDALGVEIGSLERGSKEWKEVVEFLCETYYPKSEGTVAKDTEIPSIIHIYKLNKESEKNRFDGKIGNEQLLYHGSKLSSWVGILSRGLLLPKQVTKLGVKRTDFGWSILLISLFFLFL